MTKFLFFIGKILAAMVGIRIGTPGVIASIFLFLWALADIVQMLEWLGR